MTNERCGDCPLDIGSSCPGMTAPGICREVGAASPDRERWVSRLLGLTAPVPVVWRRSPSPPGHFPENPAGAGGNAALVLLSIIACDYRIPLKSLRNEGSDGYSDCGCGYTAKCLAGRSSRKDGSVGSECFSCEHAGHTC